MMMAMQLCLCAGACVQRVHAVHSQGTGACVRPHCGRGDEAAGEPEDAGRGLSGEGESLRGGVSQPREHAHLTAGTAGHCPQSHPGGFQDLRGPAAEATGLKIEVGTVF